MTAAAPGSNVDVVRRFYDAWTSGDVPGPLDLLHPDAEYVNPAGAIEPGTRRGRDAFTSAIRRVFEAYEYWRSEVESLEPAGDHVVAVVTYSLRGRGSGVEIRGRESALWTLRDGKVVRYEWFHGVDDARAAAAADPASRPGSAAPRPASRRRTPGAGSHQG